MDFFETLSFNISLTRLQFQVSQAMPCDVLHKRQLIQRSYEGLLTQNDESGVVGDKVANFSLLGKELIKTEILSTKWQHKLSAPKPNETFEEVYTRARTLEYVMTSSFTSQLQTKSAAIGTVMRKSLLIKSASEPIVQNVPGSVRNWSGDRATQSHSRTSNVCYNCDRPGHIARYWRERWGGVTDPRIIGVIMGGSWGVGMCPPTLLLLYRYTHNTHRLVTLTIVLQPVITKIEDPTDWCAEMVVVPKPNCKLCGLDETEWQCQARTTHFALSGSDQALFQARCQLRLLDPDSAKLTTFITPFGRFCFNRLQFGITSASEHFQMSDLSSRRCPREW